MAHALLVAALHHADAAGIGIEGLAQATTYYFEITIVNNLAGQTTTNGVFTTKSVATLAYGEGYYEGGLLQGYYNCNNQWGGEPNADTLLSLSWNGARQDFTRTSSFALGPIAAYARQDDSWTNELDPQSPTYTWKNNGQNWSRWFVYEGEMWMERDKTYHFATCFFVGSVVQIDGQTIVSEYGDSSAGTRDPYEAEYTPPYTGWHPVKIGLGSTGNGGGACSNPWQGGSSSPFYPLSTGLAWNTNEITTVTTSNASQWKKLLDAGDRHLFRARGKQGECAFLDQDPSWTKNSLTVPVRIDSLVDGMTLTVYITRNPNAWYFEDRWERSATVASVPDGASVQSVTFSGIDTSTDWYVSARLSDGSKYDQWTDPVKWTPVIGRDPPTGTVTVGTPDFTSNTATVNVTSFGDDATSVSIVLEYATDSSFSSKQTVDLGTVGTAGSKSTALSSLAAGTTYYVRAVLTGIPSGLGATTDAVSFTTPAYTAPTIASVTAAGTGTTHRLPSDFL